MSKIYNRVDELIGKTPLVRLNNIEAAHGLSARLLCKLEFFNPGGSVKDRVGLRMIEAAEKSGKLNKDSVIIEPTSGNTGIGISLVCAARGYRAIIVMPETMSEERKMLMRAYGAELVLTEGSLGMKGAISKAEEMVGNIPGAILAGQFINPENPMAHYLTTGPEIYEDTDGEVDIFVSGVGTGGTVTGTARYLKEKRADIRVIGVEPERSAVLSGKPAGAHGLQGIGAGFIPDVLDTSLIDEIITRTEDEAYAAARMLGAKEGILVGISSGAALSAAIEVAKREENRGKTVVVILPDTGERYLSTDLFKNK